ncbi:MAG TPA: nuclear transport factor 2 family protein [Thermoleophilaceae bacterium]|nr:nuclear transport factor 2 family protein [Thermoleophilaceae bacterium]
MNERDIPARLRDMIENLDPEAEYEWRHEDFVADMPQSNERVRGRENMREFQRAYPADTMPKFTVKRIVGGGNVWTVMATGDYGGQVFHVVVVFEFREGKIARETRYYAEPFEAPEWRAQWVEEIEPGGGPRA